MRCFLYHFKVTEVYHQALEGGQGDKRLRVGHAVITIHIACENSDVVVLSTRVQGSRRGQGDKRLYGGML